MLVMLPQTPAKSRFQQQPDLTGFRTWARSRSYRLRLRRVAARTPGSVPLSPLICAPSRNCICSSSPPAMWHRRAQVRLRSWGCQSLDPSEAGSLPDDPPDQLFPDPGSPNLSRAAYTTKDDPFLDLRSVQPSVENCPYPLGTGTVRMCPPLPNRMTTAQCSSRCWKSLSLRLVSSALRKPHPRRGERIA